MKFICLKNKGQFTKQLYECGKVRMICRVQKVYKDVMSGAIANYIYSHSFFLPRDLFLWLTIPQFFSALCKTLFSPKGNNGRMDFYIFKKLFEASFVVIKHLRIQLQFISSLLLHIFLCHVQFYLFYTSVLQINPATL